MLLPHSMWDTPTLLPKFCSFFSMLIHDVIHHYPYYIFLDPSWPCDVCMNQQFISSLIQIVACGLDNASHYLNQYWFIVYCTIGKRFSEILCKIKLFIELYKYICFKMSFAKWRLLCLGLIALNERLGKRLLAATIWLSLQQNKKVTPISWYSSKIMIII